MLATRPDLAPAVHATLHSEGDPAEQLELLSAQDGATFAAFALAVCGGYFMNREVCELLGLPGSSPRRNPARPDEAARYLEGGLLDPVVERGSIYRPIPKDEA